MFEHSSIASIDAMVALLSALFVGVPFLGKFHQVVEDDLRIRIPNGSPNGAIAYFGLLAFLYVGIESATGNWMSTYASRVVAWNYSRSTLAAACFWAALLLGRAITPAILFRLSEQKLYLISRLVQPPGFSCWWPPMAPRSCFAAPPYPD